MTDEGTIMNGIAENGDSGDDALPVHPLAFDWAIYAHHLKESDLSESQKRQLIETLWTIATIFADIGFGTHPVQQASGQDACGEQADLAALIADDVLCLGDNSETSTNEKSGESVAPLPEGSPR